MMFSITKLLAMAGILALTVIGTPIDDAAPATKSCNPVSTFTAKFDKLPTAHPVPHNLGTVDWSGWTVVNLGSNGFQAPSGSNGIVAATSQTSGIVVSNGADIISLASFYFGCTGQLPAGGAVIPLPCSLEVTSLADTYQIDIQNLGPYGFSADINDGLHGIPQNMSKVDVELSGSQFYFHVVEGVSSSVLYLDNVVIEQQNPKCRF